MSKKNQEIEEVEQVGKEEIRYSKKQLVSSKKYGVNKDLLQVLLNDDGYYTLDEVESQINEFKKRRV